MSDERAARADRLGDYFELQLRFAALMAERTGRSLTDAVRHHTNFHRRFGFGDPDAGLAPGWADYAGRLSVLHSFDAQIAWTQAFFVAASPETPLPGRRLFGCFSYEQPDAQGMVRIHFGNRDRDGSSPLSRNKIERRKEELTAMIVHLCQQHPEAKTIRGISWLYHLGAYLRLFPSDYGASAQLAEPVRLIGTSSWGQFLKHDETIKPVPRDAFLRNLARLDAAAPWRSFPLPPLMAQAPIACFAAFYQPQC